MGDSNNIIHDSKCMGISIGRDDLFHGDLESERFRKSGHQHQLELIFEAGSVGWSKEHIGSHVICDNIIYNCGQDGIGGNLGCIFSRISHNRIYHIGTRQEFFGHEIAGIKLHTAIDVEIEGETGSRTVHLEPGLTGRLRELTYTGMCMRIMGGI